MRQFPKQAFVFAVLFATALVLPLRLHAQSLSLEGETGGFIVPAAYMVPAETGHKWAMPTMAFHYIAGGPVLGDFYNSSITGGYRNFVEFGYTRVSHSNGRDTQLGKLWEYAGYDVFHAKVKLIGEDRGGHKWIPAIAAGGIVRINDQYVTGALSSPNCTNSTSTTRDTHCGQTNADAYIAATKLVRATKIPLLLDGGIRWTNAQLFGAGGNASSYVSNASNPFASVNPDQTWHARGFAGIGIPIPVSKSPSAVIVQPGAEISQQPRYTQYTAGTHLPSTESYGLRFTKLPNFRWTLDAGVGHIGNTVAPGVGDIAAAQLHANLVKSLSLSYRF